MGMAPEVVLEAQETMECDVTPEKVGGVVQEDDGVEEIVKFTITEVSEKEEVIIPENVDITQDVTDSRDSPAVEEVLPIETSAPEPVLRRSTLQRLGKIAMHP
uniref:Uncharacterized protein n=1 Tax=Phlebotomus papatasi TaxID=29031 RepID=A0A1B0DG94_PHLPP